MHHVAIMNKSWKLIPQILSSKKTIESRWYQTRRAPWGAIKAGDTIYFKNSGEPVTAVATVADVLAFDGLPRKKLTQLLAQYGGSPGICFSSPTQALRWTSGKRYGILIFLKNPRTVKPFKVNKQGFGNACAWMTVSNIASLRMD